MDLINKVIDWDVSLRWQYIRFFVFMIFAGFAASCALTVILGEQVINRYWFLTACLLPQIGLFWNEAKKNWETVKSLRAVRKRMELKWRDVLTGQLPIATLAAAARDWQQLIFQHRELSPLLPTRYYLSKRPEDEMKMQKACNALVEEVLSALAKPQKRQPNGEASA